MIDSRAASKGFYDATNNIFSQSPDGFGNFPLPLLLQRVSSHRALKYAEN